MKLNDLSITQKLMSGFGAILVVIIASSSFLAVEMRHASEIERVSSTSSGAIDLFDEADAHLNAARAETIRYVMSGLPADREKIKPQLDVFTRTIDKVASILKLDAPTLLPDLTRYKAAAQSYVEKTMRQEVTLADDPATRPEAVHVIVAGLAHQYVVELQAAAKATREHIEDWSASYSRAGASAMSRMFWVTLGSGLTSLLLGLIMMRVISRSISRPIDAMAAAMAGLAAGDLAVAVPALGERHEIGRMAAAVQVFKESALAKTHLEAESAQRSHAIDTERAQNEAQKAAAAAEQARVVAIIADGLEQLAKGKLNHKIDLAFPADYERLRVDYNAATTQLLSTMVLVAQNSSAISSGTRNIATAADDLSLRTERQAASLEQTAAALSQLTDMVNKTMFGAREARELVLEAQAQAERSSDVVGHAVSAIHDISRSSGQIGQIIGVIDEIAFQTNLLALNAGVEAARAGESGRGFAVVASEVRALAQRSAEAAKEIKGLINASSGLVQQGVDLVGRTGEALLEIKTSVGRITKVVADISEAAREQAAGLDEINNAVGQMDSVTQQNAAMVEDSTAASHSLAGETADLVAVIEKFDLGDARRASTPVVLAAKRQQRPVRPAQMTGKKVVNSPFQATSTDVEDWTEF